MVQKADAPVAMDRQTFTGLSLMCCLEGACLVTCAAWSLALTGAHSHLEPQVSGAGKELRKGSTAVNEHLVSWHQSMKKIAGWLKGAPYLPALVTA